MPASLTLPGTVTHTFSIPAGANSHDGRSPALERLRIAVESAVPGIASWVHPWIVGPELHLAQDQRVWMLSPLTNDPLLQDGGRYVLPAKVITDLHRVAAANVGFQQMAVAHEIDRTGPVRYLVEQLRDGPRSCPPELAKTLVGEIPADPRAVRLVRAMNCLVTKAGVPMNTLARHLYRSAAELDPVIFGVIGAEGPAEPGRPALWVACASWEW